jgi:Spy/CpxP family protein refolding chaperone
MAKKAWKGLKEILTGDQVERLKGIEIQIVGNRAVTDPEIGRSLGVTEAQQTKIRSLMDQQREANRSVMEKVQNGEIDRSEIRAAMDRNNKELNKQIGNVLTSDQKSHMESMKGKPFQQEDQNPGG